MAEGAADLVGAATPATEHIERAREAERAADYAGAREHYQTALFSLSSSRHAGIAASLLRWIGDTHRDEGDKEAALDAYTVARAVAELNDDAVNVAYVLNSLGILEWQWGRLDAAARLYGEAQKLASSAGETRLLAMVEQNKGVLANVRGDLIGALKHYRRSLAAYRKLGDMKRMAGVVSNIGMVHTDLQEWDKARATFEASAELCERVGDLSSRLMVDINRTELHLLMGEPAEASRYCDAAFMLAQRLGHQVALGEVHKNYGTIYRLSGRIGMAETHLRKAYDIGDAYANPLLLGEVQRELAEVYRLQERNSEALRAFNHAHKVFSDLRAHTDVADVTRRLADLEAAFLEVVRKWGDSIESKDRYTAGHCERVADYSCMLAERMGFDPQTLTWFRMGALLHDVGKTMVPAEILNKRGTLTTSEWEIMRAHPLAGVELLSAIDFPWDIRPMIRSHHERWDGRGYPEGLRGPEIPLAARILCVADVFDALTTDRAYRGAYSPTDALDIMFADSGRIFDPEPLRLFRELIRARGATPAPLPVRPPVPHGAG